METTPSVKLLKNMKTTCLLTDKEQFYYGRSCEGRKMNNIFFTIIIMWSSYVC